MEINIRDEYQDVFPQELESNTEFEELQRSFNGTQYHMKHTSLGPCYLTTDVYHNGYIPGDGGHGGRVHISFTSDYLWDNDGSIRLDLEPRVVHTAKGLKVYHDTFGITLDGEWERKQFIDSLKNIINELENYDKLHG